ncbi:hypothetical protein Dda_6856 [Drechslerella dactyloides]|uniref:Uncharacterized protein n=1 Tax=Drechslerella dactyloides TaxID=74499 RepID=A0AAD6NHX0_DREDA|nr:hypothetical protein Dda_6856 [Drechslerella dactyloides]
MFTFILTSLVRFSSDIFVWLYLQALSFATAFMYFLPHLKEWAPFQIDALGLITIVGTVEVDRAIGRLVRSAYAEFAPLLGAYTIASNQIAETIPGFVLYNITDGIKAVDLTGWFTRWLTCQPLQYNATVITTSLSSPLSLRDKLRRWVFGSIHITLMLGIMALAGVIGDWWGFMNGASILVSVLVRYTIVELNRRAIDDAAVKAHEESDEDVKIIVTIPNGKAVTIHTRRKILLYCLLTNPRPKYPTVYKVAQFIGWTAFGCHIVALGMSTLVLQILTVVLLAASTVLVTYRVGDDEGRISRHLELNCINAEGQPDFRAFAYARLKMTEKEEESMLLWNLFPHRSNEKWWSRYMECKGDISKFQNWDRILSFS